MLLSVNKGAHLAAQSTMLMASKFTSGKSKDKGTDPLSMMPHPSQVAYGC